MRVPLSRSSLALCTAGLLLINHESHAQQRGNGAARGAAPAASAVFTAAQASRGEKVFSANCATCHGRKDMSNPDFQLKWNGRTVYDLFERVRSTMPESDPGSLSTSEYADVVAYLLKLNGMREGRSPLTPGAALRQQKLTLTGASK